MVHRGSFYLPGKNWHERNCGMRWNETCIYGCCMENRKPSVKKFSAQSSWSRCRSRSRSPSRFFSSRSWSRSRSRWNCVDSTALVMLRVASTRRNNYVAKASSKKEPLWLTGRNVPTCPVPSPPWLRPWPSAVTNDIIYRHVTNRWRPTRHKETRQLQLACVLVCNVADIAGNMWSPVCPSRLS